MSFIEVTKKQFFDFIGPRDICVSSHKDFSLWETRSRSIIGKTIPGWGNARIDGIKIDAAYFLDQEFVR